MASRAKAKPSDWLVRAKKKHGKVVAARMKEIAKSKRRGSRDRGYTRDDLEALRDGGE